VTPRARRFERRFWLVCWLAALALGGCASEQGRYDAYADAWVLSSLYGQARYEEALALSEESVRRSETKLGVTHSVVAELLTRQSRIYLALGQPESALPVANRALAIQLKRRGSHSGAVASARIQLADVHVATGNYAAAERELRRVFEMYQSDRDFEDIGGVHERKHRDRAARAAFVSSRLAGIYRRLGDPAQAQEWADRAHGTLARLKGRGDADVARTQIELATLSLEQGDSARAAWLYENAQEALEETSGSNSLDVGNVLLRRSRLHRKAGDHERARWRGEEALYIHEQILGLDNPRLGWSVYGLAETLREGGDHDHAEKLYVRAVALVEPADLPRLKWQLYGGYAQLLAETGRRPAAIFYGKRSINRLQQVRSNIDAMQASLQASFVEENRGYYERLADWLIEEGRLPEAQGVLAMLKEDEFSDFIRRGKEGSREAERESVGFTVSEEEAERNYREASRGVTRLAAEVATLTRRQALGRQPLNEAETKELAAKRAQLREMRGSFRERLGQVAEGLREEGRSETLGATQLTSLRSLRRTLRELGRGTVLIHYLVTRDRLHAILTTPEIQLVRSTPIAREELYRRVEALRRRLSDPRLRDPRPEAAALFAVLIEPLRADLEAAGARTLMVSLDGALRYVPLAALWDPAREHFLVEDYATVLYLEAGRQALERPSRATWTVAGMGLTREVGGFSKLPGATVELEAIVRRGPRDSDGVLEGEIFLDEAFTADALSRSLERRYPVVHLATHFVLKPGTDADSFLLLGDGSRLSLGEMRDRDIAFDDVELLTLSACETAVGSGGMGEEIEGFGALAVHQGASGVLATLWSVSDLTTAVFMPEFYAAKSSEGLTKAAALRQAQLFFLEEDIATRVRSVSSAGLQLAMRGGDGPVRAPRGYRHPYFWAPFVLLGNWL